MENLKIYIDRLKGGQILQINESLPPDFLAVDEKELTFEELVRVQGEAYLANDHLILHLNIETSARLPCSICNDSAPTPIAIKNIYLSKPLEEIKGSVFDLTDEVRENILLQTPLFTECNNGKCPDRENVNKFICPREKEKKSSDIVHFPFADLYLNYLKS